MRTLTLLRPYNGKPVGEKIIVTNNAAHDLIERGVASLSKAVMHQEHDKQMRPGRKQNIRTK